MTNRKVLTSSKRYPEEYKIEAVKQVTEKGHSVAEVAGCLGTTTHSLYAWIKRYSPDASHHQAKSEESAEIRRLKKELQRVTDERDILKKRCTSQTSPIEVYLYQSEPNCLDYPPNVQSSRCSS